MEGNPPVGIFDLFASNRKYLVVAPYTQYNVYTASVAMPRRSGRIRNQQTADRHILRILDSFCKSIDGDSPHCGQILWVALPTTRHEISQFRYKYRLRWDLVLICPSDMDIGTVWYQWCLSHGLTIENDLKKLVTGAKTVIPIESTVLNHGRIINKPHWVAYNTPQTR